MEPGIRLPKPYVVTNNDDCGPKYYEGDLIGWNTNVKIYKY